MGKTLNAFHVNWTKPFFLANPNRQYVVEDYDLCTTILSALEWRNHNGGIKMITDKIGAEYYTRLGLEHIWDMGLDVCLDTLIDETIKPLPFWAAGKIFALRRQPTPCVMLDTDFIVWNSLASNLTDTTLAVAHFEDINHAVYPEKSFFDVNDKYRFPAEWDWTALPCNTALLYISDERFKKHYASESIRFMRNLRKSKDITPEMVFAEQRLLAMCAAAEGIGIKTLLDLENLDTQNSFTHVWGYKKELQRDADKCRKFCISCIKRIKLDFPKEVATLKKIESLEPYFSN